MASRSYTDTAPTAATMALNAQIYGFGGHSLVTPHTTLRQLWWTDRRIHTKVSRSFVVSKLKGEERGFLDKPLAFGEGLTDDTYMEWILERAKRLFLILADIGVPDQIFGCIDDSWDDDELPIALENVPQLDLSYEYDPVLNQKFYNAQFLYLLRELRRGRHIDYGPKEYIPMEHAETCPPAVNLQVWDRVFIPGKPDNIYMRRKFALRDKETGQDLRSTYMQDIKQAQSLPHQHIASVWASYTTFEGAGYVISDFVGEHTLATFIDHRLPPQLSRVSVSDRPVLLWGWMHCLADALASLHHRGVAHTAIRPSNIIINRQNHIAFADVGFIRTFQRGKRIDRKEAYDYAAPESHISKDAPILPSTPPLSSMSAFSKLRKLSGSIGSSSTSSSPTNSTRSSSFCSVAPVSPPTPSSPAPTSAVFPWISTHNYSRHISHAACPSPVIPFSPTPSVSGCRIPLTATTTSSPSTLTDFPAVSPQMCDIYSLACVYLDILTFMLRGKRTEFIKFRSAPRASTTAKPTTRSRSSSFSSSKSAAKLDTSFHSCPTRLHTWLDILEAEADKHGDQIFRGITPLLPIIRQMLHQDPALRPPATHIRDSIQEILSRDCKVYDLCCTGRVWETCTRRIDDDDCPNYDVDSGIGIAISADPARNGDAVTEPKGMQSPTSTSQWQSDPESSRKSFSGSSNKASSPRTSFFPTPSLRPSSLRNFMSMGTRHEARQAPPERPSTSHAPVWPGEVVGPAGTDDPSSFSKAPHATGRDSGHTWKHAHSAKQFPVRDEEPVKRPRRLSSAAQAVVGATSRRRSSSVGPKIGSGWRTAFRGEKRVAIR